MQVGCGAQEKQGEGGLNRRPQLYWEKHTFEENSFLPGWFFFVNNLFYWKDDSFLIIKNSHIYMCGYVFKGLDWKLPVGTSVLEVSEEGKSTVQLGGGNCNGGSSWEL